MTRQEQAQVVREQRAGYELFHRLDAEAASRMTIEDRLAAFNRILSLSRYLPPHDSRSDDDDLARIWTKVRTRYESTQ